MLFCIAKAIFNEVSWQSRNHTSSHENKSYPIILYCIRVTYNHIVSTFTCAVLQVQYFCTEPALFFSFKKLTDCWIDVGLNSRVK